MNIQIPQEVLEQFGEDRVLEILNSKVEELQNQVISKQKIDLGEKLYAIKDTPEIVTALAKAEVINKESEQIINE